MMQYYCDRYKSICERPDHKASTALTLLQPYTVLAGFNTMEGFLNMVS